MSDSTCTHERTEYRRHADGLLEKLTCRDCGMIRGKARPTGCRRTPAMLAGGIEAWPSGSSAGPRLSQAVEPVAAASRCSCDLWNEFY